jgi:hypothetical protein
MFGISNIVSFMKEQFGLMVGIENVGEESLLLYHEEVDENLIPQDILSLLPDPIQFNIYSITGDYEWILGVALESVTYNPIYLVCLRDGERVSHQWLKEYKEIKERD